MNDYEMIKLASSRGHDFRREAAQHRLATSAARRGSRPGSAYQPIKAPRRTLRLTLASLIGRASA